MVNPIVRKFVNDWLWESGKRKTSGMEWDNTYIEDTIQMITDFYTVLPTDVKKPLKCLHCGYEQITCLSCGSKDTLHRY